HKEIGAGLWTRPALAPAKEVEDIPKTGEIRGKAAAPITSCAGIGSFRGIGECLVAHVVVLRPFLSIGKNAVCLVDGLELLFRSRILADIRVVFPGEVAVGFLDLFLVSRPRYSEGIIVVAHITQGLLLIMYTFLYMARTVKVQAQPGEVEYDVESYISMLRLGKRSEQTITNYRKIINQYARFIGVPLNEVHHYLDVGKLLKFAGSRKGYSERGTKNFLSVLRRYFMINGVQFDELQFNAVSPKVTPKHEDDEENDKPLTREILQRMMDLADIQGKAW